MQRLLYLLLGASLFAACSNDLDINAEYKDVTVVYGLLDQRDTLQWVKINKAFLGNGSAIDMALVADSNEYSDEAITLAEVERLDDNGNVVQTFTLHDTVVSDRLPGAFYGPEQKLFYFKPGFAQMVGTGSGATPMYLFQDDRYRIHIRVKGKDIYSTTPIVNNFSFSGAIVDTSLQETGNRINLRNFDGTDYQNFDIKWRSSIDGKRCVASYRFRYDEVTGSTVVPRTLEGSLGTKVNLNSQVSNDLVVSMNGASFYQSLADVVKSNPNWQSVDRRVFRGLDFIVTAANDDFNTYLQLTEPVSGIVEDRPAYSNVTGAIGLWGSRYTKSLIGKRLGSNSLNELFEGQHTGGLNFCSA
ncbi:MAG TPA: hypothetical protein PK760_15410, partial [Flavobacteriales bacterium]|nr:hypothetical protein [Flavobacteriales bacterium]